MRISFRSSFNPNQKTNWYTMTLQKNGKKNLLNLFVYKRRDEPYIIYNIVNMSLFIYLYVWSNLPNLIPILPVWKINILNRISCAIQNFLSVIFFSLFTQIELNICVLLFYLHSIYIFKFEAKLAFNFFFLSNKHIYIIWSNLFWSWCILKKTHRI